MALYSNSLASHSYRFKRLMLAYTHTEIEQTLRNARLLFEKLDKVLDLPTEATERYRLSIEQLVKVYQMHGDITQFQADLESQYIELSKLL
ncbi:MAG: hypothetical protein KME09_22475 [Pleurocapsa minor HA4230-MV1]|nr:hypothetical protein [Pleurocapsa minor HA4230-MV1]